MKITHKEEVVTMDTEPNQTMDKQIEDFIHNHYPELFKEELPIIVMDDDFFEFLEEESVDTCERMDINIFAIYYKEWAREHVSKK